MESAEPAEGMMKAAYLTDVGIENLEYGELPIPKPEKGQVLIRVEAGVLSPSDIYTAEGKNDGYTKFIYPFTPGWEGSGTVVESGGGLHGWFIKGKRVAFTKCEEPLHEGAEWKIGGSLAQYAVTNAFQCIPIDDDMSFVDAANMTLNPLTAMAIADFSKGSQAIVFTAGASQLGKMLASTLREQNIEPVYVVRKEEQAKDLKDNFGVTHVLNSTDEDFLPTFKKLWVELNVDKMFDCVGGSLCGKLLSNLPPGSNVYLIGDLSESSISDIRPMAILAKGITFQGFMLRQWLATKNPISMMRTIGKIKKLARNELSTEVQKEFELKDIQEAVEYYRTNWSKGKVILLPK